MGNEDGSRGIPISRRTRRRVLRAGGGAALATGSVFAAACAGASPTAKGADVPTPSGQPVTLRFMGRGTLANQELQKNSLAAFQQAQPKIKVEMEVPATFLPALLAQIAGGDPVDVAYTAFGNFRGLARQNALVELDPFIARDVKQTDYYAYALESGRYNGKMYVFAYDVGTYALAYNKQLFDKAQIKYPDDTWTWDTYADVAARLTVDQNGRRTGESGFDPMRIAQYGSSPIRGDWYYYIWANGGDIVTPDRKKTTIDSAVAIDTIQWLADMGTKKVINPTPAYPEADQAAINGDAGWTGGRVAMTPQGRWRVPEFRRLAQFKWDVVPMPKGKGGRIGFGWGSGMSVISAAKHRAEAWELVKFFGADGQKALVEGGLNVPPIQKMANSDLFLKSTPPDNNKAYLDAIANVKVNIAGYVIETDKFNAVLNPVLNNIWAGKDSARAAIPPLVPQLNDVLAQTQP
jgi:multiple sugar transport system substrate-binding protein